MPPISKRHLLKRSLVLYDQLLGEPLLIQQIIEFFCAVVSVPTFGIVPLATAVLIVTDAPDICV